MKVLDETTAPMIAAIAGFALAVAVGEGFVIPNRVAPAEAEAARWRAECTAARAELDAARRADLHRDHIPPQNLPTNPDN